MCEPRKSKTKVPGNHNFCLIREKSAVRERDLVYLNSGNVEDN